MDLFLRLLATGDVLTGGHNTEAPAVNTSDRQGCELHRKCLAVFTAIYTFSFQKPHVVELLCRQRFLLACGPENACLLTDELLSGISVNFCLRRVGIDDLTRGITQGYANGETVHGLLQHSQAVFHLSDFSYLLYCPQKTRHVTLYIQIRVPLQSDNMNRRIAV